MRKFRASMEPFWDLKSCKVSDVHMYPANTLQAAYYFGKYSWWNFTYSLGLRNPVYK